MTTDSDTGIFPWNAWMDLEFTIPWPADAELNPLDLTDWTVNLVDVDPVLEGHISATKSATPVDGRITVRIEWHDTFKRRVSYPFRLHISNGTDDAALNLFAVVYK